MDDIGMMKERLDRNDIEMVRIWEAIQRIDKLVRFVEDEAADAITIARLLAKNPNYRGNP